ncbi:MAG TPA: amidohydrolase family protein [Dehalococcoidia bacterium]|nr:amidohydrolase family protein [Dehalococcoidia bacterium]
MIIDAHCHILPDSFPERHAELAAIDATCASLFPNANPRMATAEDLTGAMQKAGVDHSVVMGMGWANLELAREANDYIIASVARFSRQLSGFCSVNPAWGTVAVHEMERCAEAGLLGLGELHPDTQGFDLTDQAVMEPLMGQARELGWPVLVHASEPVGHLYPGKGHTTPDRVYRFIQNFPDNIIICAHWGGGLPFYALMPEVPAVLRNVYFDSAASPYLYRQEVFTAVAGLVGADRIIFGTDYPLIGHRRLLQQVQDSGLKESDGAAILGGNAAGLLRLPLN